MTSGRFPLQASSVVLTRSEAVMSFGSRDLPIVSLVVIFIPSVLPLVIQREATSL